MQSKFDPTSLKFRLRIKFLSDRKTVVIILGEANGTGTRGVLSSHLPLKAKTYLYVLEPPQKVKVTPLLGRFFSEEGGGGWR